MNWYITINTKQAVFPWEFIMHRKNIMKLNLIHMYKNQVTN